MKSALAVLGILLLFLILLSNLTASLEYIGNSSLVAESFFRDVLRNAEVSETVIVRVKQFVVENGNVVTIQNSRTTHRERLEALKLTYALTTARRSPLYGLAGTDPKTLRESVRRLQEIIHDLSIIQNSRKDAFVVASSLYPVDFLYSLADLEESRLRFISHRTDYDAKNYESQLKNTIRAAQKDAKNFEKALRTIIADKPKRMLGPGGVITTESLLETVRLIQDGIIRTEGILMSRNLCLMGKVEYCNESQIEIPKLPALISNLNTRDDRHLPQIAEEVQSIYRDAGLERDDNGEVIIVLDSSKCLATLPKPYFFSVRTITDDGSRTFSMRFRGDILFNPTDGMGRNTLRYLREKLGISFQVLNPSNFYNCPETASDIGKAYAIKETLGFANKYPSLAIPARGQLLKNPRATFEEDAIAYIQSAFLELSARKDSALRPTRNDLINLILMFHEKSADLEFLIDSMIRTYGADLRLKTSGVPFDLTANYLFLTHSAFPSLFLLQNPSAGTANVSIRVQNDKDAAIFFSHTKRYSLLQTTVGREKIVSDIHAFLKMENLLFFPSESQYKEKQRSSNKTKIDCASVLGLQCLKNTLTNFISENELSARDYTTEIEKKCGKGFQEKQLSCWNKFVTDVISEHGLDDGFALVKKLYEKNPPFRPLCHRFAMDIGASVYKDFPDYAGLSYTPISVTCNYGFYQKYPHSLLLATGDISKAQEFCEYVGKELALSVPGAESECFRGIGRGLPFVDESKFGDVREMAEIAIQSCKNISPNRDDLKTCLSGAFNQLGREQIAKNYGLSVYKPDPLWLCREQPEEITPYCYGNFKWADAPKVDLETDLSSALEMTLEKYAKDTPATASSIVWRITFEEGKKSVSGNEGYSDIINSCQILPVSFQGDCLQGFAVGLAKHSFPGKQHEAVLNFCEKVRINKILKYVDCAPKAINYLREFYAPEQFRDTCSLFKRKLGVVCK